MNREYLLSRQYITKEQYERGIALVREYKCFYNNLRCNVHEKIFFPKFSEGKKNRVKRGLHPKILYTYLLWKKVEKVITGEDK